MKRACSNLIEVPPGCPKWITAELIALTLEVWQPYYAERLQVNDAVEMILSTGHLINLVKENRVEKVRRPGPSQQP